MAPTGEHDGTGEVVEYMAQNEIIARGYDPSAPTGESDIVKTRDGHVYRVVIGDAPNVIRNGRVEPRCTQ